MIVLSTIVFALLGWFFKESKQPITVKKDIPTTRLLLIYHVLHFAGLPIKVMKGYVGPACILIFLSLALYMWVMLENRFFSPGIIIQKSHKVINTGPYRIIRHPGYLAYMLFWGGQSLYTGGISIFLWGIGVFLYLWRIKTEERVLLGLLPGYKYYCGKVRSRLIPYIY